MFSNELHSDKCIIAHGETRACVGSRRLVATNSWDSFEVKARMLYYVQLDFLADRGRRRTLANKSFGNNMLFQHVLRDTVLYEPLIKVRKGKQHAKIVST